MTAPTRRALLRELSNHPQPERPLIENDPSPEYAAALRRDYLALLIFAASICRVDPKKLTPLDLMAALSNLRGASRRPRRLRPLHERFFEKVQKTENCWLWLSWRRRGYGVFHVAGDSRQATHVAWFLEHGDWPASGHYVCHHCDEPNCVRPSHLFLGTQRDNMLDSAKKGRNYYQRHPEASRFWGLATHCRRGHAMVDGNLYFKRDGYRNCRQCAKDRAYQRWARLRRVQQPLEQQG